MWWARRERERVMGEKGEGEVWWARREREKCGGREGRGRSVVGEKMNVHLTHL